MEKQQQKSSSWGKIHKNYSLKEISWLGAGGAVDVLLEPFDQENLSCFLKTYEQGLLSREFYPTFSNPEEEVHAAGLSKLQWEDVLGALGPCSVAKDLRKIFEEMEEGGQDTPEKLSLRASKEACWENLDPSKYQLTPPIILGALSNVLIRQGGVSGTVLRLGKGLDEFYFADSVKKVQQHPSWRNGPAIFQETCSSQRPWLYLGAGLRNRYVAQKCAKEKISGLEFLFTIPGTIGGGLAMNAGCYGSSFGENVGYLHVMSGKGVSFCVPASWMNYRYRTQDLPAAWVILGGWFFVEKEEKIGQIDEKMSDMLRQRNEDQPTGVKTGGSTFKNLSSSILTDDLFHQISKEDGMADLSKEDWKKRAKSAWYWVDRCGLRGKDFAGVCFADKHCNFLINQGQASPWAIEALGEWARQWVQKRYGISLIWEIQRLGRWRCP